jgi:hypothetical protein
VVDSTHPALTHFRRVPMKSTLLLTGLLIAVTATTAVAADLPLERVVLFSSGVGYFHREGTVQGETTVELSFRTAQINDLLKSLVLQDFDGGTIAPVTYAPEEPIERTLSSFAVDISDNPALYELLDRLRGTKAEIKTSDGVKTGTIVGMETQQKSVEDSILEFEVVNLLTEAGLTQEPVWHIKSIRILDEKVDSDLKKALEVLASSRDVDKRPVMLSFRGTGERRVSAGYLLETPVWKTSYRLVVEDEGLFLQGWAIVENTTDEDWGDVGLTLVSGRPISFIQNLYEPLYLPRPEIPPSVAAIPRPRIHERLLDEYAGEEMEGEAAEAPREEKADMARRTAGGYGGGGMGGMAGAPGMMPAPTAAVPTVPAFALAEAGAAAMAAGEKVGELFQYAIDQPVTIGRQKSAMIPIVHKGTDGEKVSVYNAGTDPKFPYNGVKLKNTTGLHLMGGPVTVFDGGIYAGDALIEDLAPDDDRLLTYAVDLDIEVEQKSKSRAEEILSVKIVRGTLEITRKQRRETDYTAKSVSADERTLLIEHPFSEDWELIEPEKPEERTRSVYRFRLDMAPKAKAELKVVEDHPISQSIALTDVDADSVALFVRMDKVSDAVKAALQKVIEMKTELADIQRQIAEREGRLEEIGEEQARIRENMKQLDRNSELYKRYVEKFTEQEDEFEKLQGEIKQLKDQETELLKQIQDYIAGLNVE